MTAAVVLALSHLEHTKRIRPSTLLSAYLLITLPLDVARSRTMWLAMQTKSICVLFVMTIAMKVLILGLESISKSRYLSSTDQKRSPEELSGIFSLSFFTWLIPLMRNGYGQLLTVEDLYPIDSKMSSKLLWTQIRREWDKWLCELLKHLSMLNV